MIPAELGVQIIRDLSDEFGVPPPKIVLDHPRCESPNILGCFIPGDVIGLNLVGGEVQETTPAHEFGHYLAWLQGTTDEEESEKFAQEFERWWVKNEGPRYGIACKVDGGLLARSALFGILSGTLFSMILDFFPKPGASREENYERGRRTAGVIAATSLSTVLSHLIFGEG